MNEPRRFDVEIIDEAPALPRGFVAPEARNNGSVQPRERDYLEGFLAKKPEPAPESGGELYDNIIAALRDIFDPEIPVNIYDLGLIYGVEIDDGHVVVNMTLTTPHCPVAESMPGEVELRVMSVPGVATCEVNLVWDPPWDPGKMADEARLELGML
ncbi:SUF system Fe-S cluster assembly protein [Sandaracinobacteroides saxicola]|uniref:SUF system Fe-S cluster assembly protein n=1 Tax=Sandaracinobacteroides saxicola TaxID=2759707 RepID=A0A7G5IG56_9SPHN|nr:SUF system Fe-S cluster assembly protein [Sandaracinobacteroides saxicola]QMW22348.1 SUF system Fe-S cluster assembly protein [Sandaracinobacteroides saxicola]